MERRGCTGWGLAIILTLIFIVLQICNIITWTWFWILSPLWIMGIIDILIILFFIIIFTTFYKY